MIFHILLIFYATILNHGYSFNNSVIHSAPMHRRSGLPLPVPRCFNILHNLVPRVPNNTYHCNHPNAHDLRRSHMFHNIHSCVCDLISFRIVIFLGSLLTGHPFPDYETGPFYLLLCLAQRRQAPMSSHLLYDETCLFTMILTRVFN